MTDLADLLATLHPLEAKVLRALAGTEAAVGEARIADLAGIQEAQARMASEWLLAKAALETASEDSTPFVALDETGQQFAKNAIPEIAIRRRLEQGPAAMADLGDAKDLSAAIGALKKQGLITVAQGKFTLADEADWSAIEQDQALVAKLATKERFQEGDLTPAEWKRATDLAGKPGKASLGIRRGEQKCPRCS